MRIKRSEENDQIHYPETRQAHRSSDATASARGGWYEMLTILVRIVVVGMELRTAFILICMISGIFAEYTLTIVAPSLLRSSMRVLCQLSAWSVFLLWKFYFANLQISSCDAISLFFSFCFSGKNHPKRTSCQKKMFSSCTMSHPNMVAQKWTKWYVLSRQSWHWRVSDWTRGDAQHNKYNKMYGMAKNIQNAKTSQTIEKSSRRKVPITGWCLRTYLPKHVRVKHTSRELTRRDSRATTLSGSSPCRLGEEDVTLRSRAQYSSHILDILKRMKESFFMRR